ncbi:MAG: hypothetical protein C0597_12375 [Marinilabiliales bacterium]|nr:MAG: hypothetical protein C0597_12375 [Marinilabiliales bacterium]
MQFRGFVDTYHAAQISHSNNFLASRSRFRGEMAKLNGNSYFFASINAVYNSTLPELSQIQFREAFMEYSGNHWGFKAGRQIIIWGKADGLKITDVISPMDLTEFLAQDYDDIRMPVNGIVLNTFGNNWKLDLVWIPLFESYLLPGANNPWGIDYSEFGVTLDEANEPEFNLSNIEYGGKLSFYLSGIDIDISALHTWNKAPVYSYSYDSTSALHIKPEHHRMGFVGLGFSKALNAFIVRGEGAFNFDKSFTPNINDYDEGILKRNSINYLVGIDWYPGSEWTITTQFSDEYIMHYTNEIDLPEHSMISTFGISKKLFRSTLSLSTFGYIDIKEGEFFKRTSADYSVSDNIHIIGGVDLFYGDEGTFGQYEDNSQMWIKAKFNF